MTKDEIIMLADKITAGIATDDEIAAYNHIINNLPAGGEAYNIIAGEEQGMGQVLRERIMESIHPPATVRAVRWWRWTAAAAILLLVSTVAYITLSRRHEEVAVKAKRGQHKDVIFPGGNKAILTLGDGAAVVLDSAANGSVARQGDMEVIKQNGQLNYKAESGAVRSAAIVYNTVSTPRGGQYQVTLADGTKVWLNAASSLRFPTVFTGGMRTVDVTGEVYFEVAKNPSMPFNVRVNGAEVQVLGTHFDVNAYGDENFLATTLLEGSVRIMKGNTTSMLKPGEQAQLDGAGNIRVEHDVNVQQVVAWKDGFFQFDNAGLKTVMRQLSRWYDVDVEYRGKIDPSMLFFGKMGRDLRLQQVLTILQKSEVNFNIEGRKIVVGS